MNPPNNCEPYLGHYDGPESCQIEVLQISLSLSLKKTLGTNCHAFVAMAYDSTGKFLSKFYDEVCVCPPL